MINFENYFNLVIICWIILFLYWLISAFFVKQSATKRNWKVMIIWRVILIILVIIFVTFDKSGSTFLWVFLIQGIFSLPILGSLLTVLGLIVVIWARISLGRNWSNYTTYKKDHELITTGSYRLIRHPIYSGAILMLIGTFVYYGSLLILLILAIATIYVGWSIIHEEKTMIKLFGEKYIHYKKKTKKLIPGIY